MSRYSKIERTLLNDAKFNSLSDDAQLVFFRLLVHPHLTVLGAMRASVAGLASEMSWPSERLSKALTEMITLGMVQVDTKAHFIWFPQFLKYNQPESPNVIKSWEQALDYLPECDLKYQLMDHAKAFTGKLSEAFQAALPDVFGKPSESLPKAFSDKCPALRESVTVTVTETEAVTETVTEAVEPPVATRKNQEKNYGVLQHIAQPAGRRGSLHPDVIFIFNAWKTTLGHPQAILDDKRKAWIARALKSGYNVSQLCEAIKGCSLTPHNMGKNERGQRYDGLHVILRDADQIDRFIHNAHSPPRERNTAEALFDSNQAVCDAWLQDKLFEAGEIQHETV